MTPERLEEIRKWNVEKGQRPTVEQGQELFQHIDHLTKELQEYKGFEKFTDVVYEHQERAKVALQLQKMTAECDQLKIELEDQAQSARNARASSDAYAIEIGALRHQLEQAEKDEIELNNAYKATRLQMARLMAEIQRLEKGDSSALGKA